VSEHLNCSPLLKLWTSYCLSSPWDVFRGAKCPVIRRGSSAH